MFLFNLQAVLVGVAVFSLPIALLELQLLVIGLNGLTISHLIATLVVGAISGVGAVLIEYFD
jgi:hypothetical protein